MNADEIVKALRSECEDCSERNKCNTINYCPNRDAADLIESLQAEIRALNDCKDKLIKQNKRVIRPSSELERREKAAVEIIPHDCGNCKYALYSGECKLILDGDEFSPDYTEGFDRDDCERWEWRGSQEVKPPKCWKESGCIFNSNNDPRYLKCRQGVGYSVEQCQRYWKGRRG